MMALSTLPLGLFQCMIKMFSYIRLVGQAVWKRYWDGPGASRVLKQYLRFS
jgi:hypothetical protein